MRRAWCRVIVAGLLAIVLPGRASNAHPARVAQAAPPATIRAPEPTPKTGSAPNTAGADATTAEAELAAADAAVDAADLARARSLYEQIVSQYPGSAAAAEARRALKILKAAGGDPAMAAPAGTTAARTTPATTTPARATSATEGQPSSATGNQPGAAEASGGTRDVVLRREPYSLRTSERLRLTTWEKLDFGVTAFLYGMSLGFSFAVAGQSDNGSLELGPVALGALAYTAGAVLYLKLGNPDRGDLPLTLAITSYVPMTTLLIANLAFDNPDEQNTSLAVAAAGLFAAPMAVLAARRFDLDPGDTQLVRDAGFWGLALGTLGALGFGGQVHREFGVEWNEDPSGRTVAGFALGGLYGGLALGALTAANTEISLERIRVTTWGGYGGAVVGLLLAAAGDADDRDLYRGLGIGALAGLTLAFLTTGSLDGIPAEDAPAPVATRRVSPSVVAIPQPTGRPLLGFGLAGSL